MVTSFSLTEGASIGLQSIAAKVARRSWLALRALSSVILHEIRDRRIFFARTNGEQQAVD